MALRSFLYRVTIGLAAIALSARSFAHETAATEIHSDAPESGITGSVELRPSWESGSGDMFGENTIELGNRFSRKFHLAYNQELHHNIRLAAENPEHEGQGLHPETGMLRGHIHNVWGSEDGKTSLSLEPRVFLPTSSEDRQKGFITAGASQVILKRKLTESVGLNFTESPTVFVYSAPGATVGDEYAANSTFQNMTQLAANVSLLRDKITLSIPVLLYLTKHADFESEAELNDAWTTILSVAPEIAYEISPGFSTGLAVVSPNLLDSSVSDHCVNHGRTSALTQVVLRASL